MGNQSSSQVDKWPQYFDLDRSADMEMPVQAQVSGSFPKWLSGSLYRNGSGLFQIGETRPTHLFDGFSVIHRWSIKDGGVTFLSSILDSDSYKKSVKCERVVGQYFASTFPDPCKSTFDKFFSYFKKEEDDNTFVSIVEHGDRLFTFTESTSIHEVDGETMHSIGKVDLKNVLAVHMGTAHPHIDRDGTMYYYATNVQDAQKTYNIVKVPPAGKGEAPFSKVEIVASIPRRWKWNIGYAHSFGISENYFIHLEQPLALNMPKLMTIGFWGGIEQCLNNYPEETIQIHVVDRRTGQRLPINFYTPHGFVFHFVNCYEESGFLICDVCMNKSGGFIRELYLENIVRLMKSNADFLCYYARFVLPLNIDKAKEGENLVTVSGSKATAVLRPGSGNCVDVTNDAIFGGSAFFELPRINYDFNGRKIRYAYGSSVLNPTNQRVMKFDLHERKMTEWKCDDKHYPGEPVFVKDPAGTSEDDGVVLCPVLAATTEQSSYLVVLDAASFKELGRATVPPDIKMSVSFHGDFYKRFS
ncbi:beta,beta-carotene 15,15'-dioxygenase [Aplysia californica]|uniref:Beta,beta-carotene 15,15'-dioxygenase n=1 Tax=Aplysia californica TaxID=6500 RepID=A0ABM0JGQ8_APLCA|nr:beta,beta-carotene 15,15'-dioxygenase [Aplysia californica]